MSLEDYNSIRKDHTTGADGPTTTPVNPVVEKEVTRIEYEDITEKEKGYGEQSLITLTSSFHRAKEDRGKYHEYALLIRHKIDKEGEPISTELEVRSPIIRQALQENLASYAYLNLDAVPIIIPKPYVALFHYRKELREYTKSPDRSEEQKRHLDVLIDMMSKYIGPTEKVYEQMIPKGMVEFDLLWTLFRAEDDIVLQNDHFRELKRVVHCEKKTKDEQTFFQVETWRWAYSSGKFGPTKETIVIPEFSGARRIIHLPIFPLNRLTEADQHMLRTELIERGRRWKELVRPEHRSYSGEYNYSNTVRTILLKTLGPIWVNPPFEAADSMAMLVVEHVSLHGNLDVSPFG